MCRDLVLEELRCSLTSRFLVPPRLPSTELGSPSWAILGRPESKTRIRLPDPPSVPIPSRRLPAGTETPSYRRMVHLLGASGS